MKSIRVIAPLLFISFVSPRAADVVRVGEGSYATVAPAGAKRPQAQIFKTAAVKGPMPSNKWWSSLAWTPLSDSMFPHPLAVRAVEGGLRVWYPGAAIAASKSGIMGGGGEDFVIGHAGAAAFSEARVDGFSDWFVSALFENGGAKLRTTFGHGSPFVFVTLNGNPTLSFKNAPKIWSGSAKDPAIGFSIGNKHYGVFVPAGSTWSDLSAAKWTADLHGKDFFSVALLPDDKPETLAWFAKHAHAHIVDSRVSWSFDSRRCTVTAKYSFTTKPMDGGETGTIFALYPHQWTHTTAKFAPQIYNSVRGPMKVAQGTSFETEMIFPGVLPSLPLTSGVDKKILAGFIGEEVNAKFNTKGDTYWLGKNLGKWATLIPIAEQAGNIAAVESFTQRTRAAMENFFTATDAGGAVKTARDGVFYYDDNWGTLIGYPASYGSDDSLNDHHFHYGYFIRAAGELARRDPAWAADAKWGGMVKMLIRDIACADRSDAMFPFLRNFDSYAGHTWASGHAKFGDGNNNESSSEAVNAWYGLILFGEAIGDTALRDLGIFLFTTEVEAINDYWFDVTGQFHPPEYTPSVVTMIWGGKGANGTWFSGDPEMVHGINFLPVTGASLYLGLYPDYCANNFSALVAENREDDAKHAAKSGKPNPNPDGTHWSAWADIIWMYRALSDPADALTQFNARAANFKPEAGNSTANVYVWLNALDAFGHVDRSITADAPFHAVFNKAGKRTHVAWNIGGEPRTVIFSDGTKLECPPHGIATQ